MVNLQDINTIIKISCTKSRYTRLLTHKTKCLACSISYEQTQHIQEVVGGMAGYRKKLNDEGNNFKRETCSSLIIFIFAKHFIWRKYTILIIKLLLIQNKVFQTKFR